MANLLSGDRFDVSLRMGWFTALGDFLSYALLAFAVWMFFHILFSRRFQHRKIMKARSSNGQYSREILHSLRSLAIFGIIAAFVVYAALSGWTRMYLDIDRYGWVWLILSIVIMVILHDAYFYWTHVLMHHRRIYRHVHRTHHLSTDPSPWAAYAFSPAEAFVQAGIGPLIVFTIPTHPIAFSAFMLVQISFNVFGHCGYEIFPHSFLHSKLGHFLNSPTHHALHHAKFNANYGLYFNVWDRLMGTNHPQYAEHFERVTKPISHEVQSEHPIH